MNREFIRGRLLRIETKLDYIMGILDGKQNMEAALREPMGLTKDAWMGVLHSFKPKPKEGYQPNGKFSSSIDVKVLERRDKFKRRKQRRDSKGRWIARDLAPRPRRKRPRDVQRKGPFRRSAYIPSRPAHRDMRRRR